jgi:hypothetical protein
MARCRVRLLLLWACLSFDATCGVLTGASYRLSTYKVTDTITVTLPARRGVLDCDARDVYARVIWRWWPWTYKYHFARICMQLEPSCYSTAVSSIAASFNEPFVSDPVLWSLMY